MTNEQDENENDDEKMVDRTFSETNNGARSWSLGGSRRTVAKSRWREPWPHVRRSTDAERDAEKSPANVAVVACMTSILMKHDGFKETETLSVCPSCVEQLEDSGENCAMGAAGSLEALFWRPDVFCHETPTGTMLQQFLVVKNTRRLPQTRCGKIGRTS